MKSETYTEEQWNELRALSEQSVEDMKERFNLFLRMIGAAAAFMGVVIGLMWLSGSDVTAMVVAALIPATAARWQIRRLEGELFTRKVVRAYVLKLHPDRTFDPEMDGKDFGRVTFKRLFDREPSGWVKEVHFFYNERALRKIVRDLA